MSLALSQAGRYSIVQALAKVNLAGYDHALVQSLSAGQKRRLSLARLLITKKVCGCLMNPLLQLIKKALN